MNCQILEKNGKTILVVKGRGYMICKNCYEAMKILEAINSAVKVKN